jgi:hypothetical protein
MTTNRQGRTRKLLFGVGFTAAALVALAFGNGALNRFVSGPAFRAALEKETAKGLHFDTVTYSPIRRIGILTAASDGARARGGRKAMTALEAHDITARFNPAGVFLRRWSVDDLHIERAEVGIQIYEPKPEPEPPKPWYAVFLPDRVYLKHVWSDHADITWRMRGKRGGLFDTHLVITPHGRDFNYEATEGVIRNPLMPELALRHTKLLITKEVFNLYNLDVTPPKGGTVHAEGTAATRGNKNLDFKFNWIGLALTDWLPKQWEDSVTGRADGELRWRGPDYKLESAKLGGAVRIIDCKITGLSFLDQIAAIVERPDLRVLKLTECTTRFGWEKTDCHLSDIEIEEKGKFRIEGDVRISNGSLGGKIDLGMAPTYLAWLPHPEEVFPRKSGGYLWTTIHLSGTLESPQQDLSPRLIDALKGSPSALLGAALRAFGAWLHGD